MTADVEPVPRPPRRTTAEVVQYHGLQPKDPMAHLMVMLADRYDLDPLLGHLEVIKTRGGPRLYITRDGYIDVAHRSGQLDGIVLEEVRRSSDKDGWTATVSVWRKDIRYPFTYSAKCSDDEAQAEQGNGEAMAVARAERRALKRAFPVLVALDNAVDYASDHADDAMRVPGVVELAQRPQARGARWTPSAKDQRDAHKAVAQLGDDAQKQFLERWKVPQFTSPWPAAAVAEVLGFGGADPEPDTGF